MKKAIKKLDYVISNEARKDWRKEANDEIDLLNEDIDTIDLPENVVLEIERLINKFRERLNDTINLFEVTPNIAFTQKDLFEYMLDDLYYERATSDESEVERMIQIVEQERKGQFVKCESLAEQIKLEEFMEQLQENPYQLKLTA